MKERPVRKDVRIDGVMYAPVESYDYAEGTIGAVVQIQVEGKDIVAVELKDFKGPSPDPFSESPGLQSMSGKRVRIMLADR